MRTSMCKFAKTLALSVALTLSATLPWHGDMAQAQSLFEPVITVNNQAITRYELQQRTQLLTLLKAPADPARLAREQLIEDRLKLQAATAQGIVVEDTAIAEGMEQFASQGNLKAAEMIKLLAQGGVSEQTFREFVRAGITWRELTRARFGARISVSEDDLEKAKDAITSGATIRVLLSEIIIPYTPQTKEQVDEIALSISQLESYGAFAAQARKYSVTPTRDQGGKLPWTPITKLPPILRPLVIGLAPGEVTDPLPLDGAVALFQMRDIQEVEVASPAFISIEYAAYYIPGGRSEQALQHARQVEADTDTCDDLYGVAHGQPESVLERGSKSPNELPNDIAIELSKLDPGEVSTALTRANGETLVLLMLCGRTEAFEEEKPVVAGEDGEVQLSQTEQLSQQIANQRLDSFSQGYLEQLRAEARIEEK